MSKILIIETSGAMCSVAMCQNGALIEEISDHRGSGMATAKSEHSTALAPFIEELIAKCGMPDAVAVSSGPGSYTGLRIGLSTAKGLCYGYGIPLIMVDSLRGIAQEALKLIESPEVSGQLTVMVDARRMEVYRADYSLDGAQLSDIEAVIVSNESFKASDTKLYLAGSGAAKCQPILDELGINYSFVEVSLSASSFCTYVTEMFDTQCFADLAYSEPTYVKEWQPYVSVAQKTH